MTDSWVMESEVCEHLLRTTLLSRPATVPSGVTFGLLPVSSLPLLTVDRRQKLTVAQIDIGFPQNLSLPWSVFILDSQASLVLPSAHVIPATRCPL